VNRFDTFLLESIKIAAQISKTALTIGDGITDCHPTLPLCAPVPPWEHPKEKPSPEKQAARCFFGVNKTPPTF
jgi:hypothetical protein